MSRKPTPQTQAQQAPPTGSGRNRLNLPTGQPATGARNLFTASTVRRRYVDEFPEENPPTNMNMVMELTDEQREEINEAFSLFDLDKDHKIDYHELKVAMKALGFEVPKPELIAILRERGVIANGQVPANPASVLTNRLFITQETFTQLMAERILSRDPLEEISRAFDLFAGVAGGSTGEEKMIRLEDLRRVARELGENLEEDELRAMIEEFDLDNDGMISREEFIEICRGE
ncbi:Calcium-binding component of the spindle pole body (SPB) half-bridge [Rhizina undulata]